jgi:hypothetical protein
VGCRQPVPHAVAETVMRVPAGKEAPGVVALPEHADTSIPTVSATPHLAALLRTEVASV